MPPTTAVYSMLNRAAARAGHPLSDRAVVSSFDAALHVVESDLGISVIPRRIAMRYEWEQRLRIIQLTDSWARRRFAVCFRDQPPMQAAAARLVEFPAGKAEAP